MASTRKKRNKITRLCNSDGVVKKDQKELCMIPKDYFDKLFQQDTCDEDNVSSLVHSCVTIEDNQSLIKDFTVD
jgi:hypothetical protein